MSTTYSTAPKSIQAQFDDLVKARFPELADAGVTFSLVMASNPEGCPVKCHGIPAAATIKINSLKQRVEGLPDLTLTIDADRWDGLRERQRTALLHHELFHVELKRDDGGAIQKDDADRPKVRLIPDGFAVTGFDELVQEYGKDSLEYQSIRAIATRWVQAGLWGQDL